MVFNFLVLWQQEIALRVVGGEHFTHATAFGMKICT
jgi:hypothetical protein